MKKHLIIQFAKAPEPGKVKTRLLTRFSPAEATSIHCELVLATFEVLQQCQDTQLQLHVSGDLRDPLFSGLGAQNIALKHQVSGDLGQKMLQALNKAMSTFDRVLLVGSDCPVLSQGVLELAFQTLDTADLVLNPAEDGGYVLIGTRRELPEAIFEEVGWGSGTVLQKTVANAEALGLSVALLPELWDVDYPEDVDRWQYWKQKRQGAA